MSDFFAQMIENKIDTSLLEIQQSMVCEITNFDKQTMRADVQPLLAEEPVGNAAARPFPIIADIPVKMLLAGDFYVRPDYAIGDKVWVSFATHKIDDSLKGNTLEASKIVFDVGSACVTGGVTATGGTTPTEFGTEAGLLIGHKDGAAYILFESGKITFKFGSDKVEMTSGGVKYFNGVTFYNLKTHTHAGPGTPPNPNT